MDHAAAPRLTEEQQAIIHRAASKWVAAAVTEHPARLADLSLAGTAHTPVLGAFVTLKRQGRLRGCCGSFGKSIELADAVQQAAFATATRDVRMPKVSPTELEYLDLEVSLLHNIEVVEVQGKRRIEWIKVGQHGLQIERGGNRGLLLPIVAVEHGLDAERFLEQVCLKAGLPPNAWMEDDARLSTFETVVVSAPFDADAIPPDALEAAGPLTAAEIAALARVCRNDVAALLTGAAAGDRPAEATDRTVAGVVITLNVANVLEPIQVERLSLRPGVPLQATLRELSRSAVNDLRKRQRQTIRADDVDVALTVLDDPAMHGTLFTTDLRGVDPICRAVLVVENAKRAWAFDPICSPDELLQRAAGKFNVGVPERASVYSLSVSSTGAYASSAPTGRRQYVPEMRPPAVAGAFYPGSRDELVRMMNDLCRDKPPKGERWAGALVPHAGLVYSGRIAAAVLQEVAIPQTVVVLAPNHTGKGAPWAVMPYDGWTLPGGTVPSDPDLARELADAIPDLELDAAAHQREHAIEVELPLLARLAPRSRIVGIVVSGGDLESLQQFAAGLAKALQQRADNVLLVMSSDLNHFAGDEENRRLDGLAIAAMERLDPPGLLETVRSNGISMCGVLSTVLGMETLKRLGSLNECKRVAYATSGDVSGDLDRVVGYAGMLFR